jgi:hypothetical protein
VGARFSDPLEDDMSCPFSGRCLDGLKAELRQKDAGKQVFSFPEYDR